MKKSVQSALMAATLLLSITSISVNAQTVSPDTSRNARTQSFSGTVTYDGSGAGTGGSEASYFGVNSGAVTTGPRNSFFGAYSGTANTTGDEGVFIGYKAGTANTSGSANTFIGSFSGSKTTTGRYNVFAGGYSGIENTTGKTNSFLGFGAGWFNTIGEANTFLGANAGLKTTSGSRNTYVGQTAGNNNQIGSGNVAVGYKAGFKELGNNKLYIANSDTIQPLIYGEFDAGKLVLNGKVGVSTSSFPTTVGTADVSTYKLFVKGGILTEEVRIRTGWADYVFQPGYQLKDLAAVEKYIEKNGHLPNVPSAKTVEEEGLSLGEIAKIQQEKIEELTLYLIEIQKKLSSQQAEIEKLKAINK
ncbi:hypothetical protein J2Y45_002322 [Dyadobacter sp. BE34]|uniref:TMF family protein n=1 Tax=Dyadobacter fermentans TaxID=94254 RepID=A0ABU1QW45_9BACT|nr:MULTISPECIES: hypothetical protein [Dyadobacter]MDR6805369.1 hypothetical protein [Dyadobacter fermentans]MDR7042871.1 hypothetical protein [Dyadobacter sp. BE242]MDR7197183.1 hypothetical protein [Dyadobacter sp. BE34]MDR7215382.1 hypothetical protein [Dyadobacter sp. BE31]MDR7262918.1 hypothetical protein [Dyadobacter sp. BE32]